MNYTNLERELNSSHNRQRIRCYFLEKLDRAYLKGEVSKIERNKLEMKSFMDHGFLYQWFTENRRSLEAKGLFVFLPDSQLLEALRFGNSWEEIKQMDEEVYSHLAVD